MRMAGALCTGAYPSCLLLYFNTSCGVPLLNVNMKTIEDEGDQGSIKMQWINLYEKTGLCYGWQSPLLC